MKLNEELMSVLIFEITRQKKPLILKINEIEKFSKLIVLEESM